MKTGFSFKGIHSSEMGISAATKVRPLIPEERRYEFALPLADGKADFSTANIYGRPFYENRVFTINMHIGAKDIFALQRKLSRLAAWFIGDGELVFDDMPTVIWQAKVIGTLDYAPEKRGRCTLVSVSFDVEPFSRGDINPAEGIYLGDALRIGGSLPLDLGQEMTFSLTGNGGVIEVMNIGNVPVRPVFEFVGTQNLPTVTLSLNGNRIKYGASGKKCSVDCERCVVTGDGVDMSSMIVSGDFPELLPGKNEIEITISPDCDCSVTVKYIPGFIYDSEYELIDWGDMLADTV